MSDDTLMERELAAVEDALATGTAVAADPAERELRELALSLRADAPAPDPAFAAALRERMEAGFPAAQDSPRGRLGALVDRLRQRGGDSGAERSQGALAGGARTGGKGWLRGIGGVTGAAAGAVAALLIAIVVAVSITGGNEQTTDSAGGGTVLRESAPGAVEGDMGSSGSAAEPAPPDQGAADSVAPVPPNASPRRSGDFAPGREQRIARAAALTLEGPGDELGRLAERVTAVTDRHHGFVLSSSVTSGTDGDAGGSLELRIPATELRAAVRDLSALATVSSSTQSGEDVTGRFVSARDRLDAARAERVSLLKRLEAADTDVEAESLRRRLDLVAGEINGLQNQLRSLRLRTNYAAVTVALEADGDDGAAAPSSTEDALDDALGSLQGTVNVALRALGVVLPLGIVALLGWLLARAIRRRRRESVLA